MTESILIVDDSTFIVEGLVALLKKRYHPIASFSGEECLEILRTATPSLIILDILMEPMDGWETLARIKENPATRHIPVLMFSAKKISPMEAEAHRIIIDDFITKPVNPKTLIEAIEKVLARQKFNRQVVDTWTASGVAAGVIDEYLTLKMNLDVDISLLVVMQKQLDLAYMGAVNRDELLVSIAALEERIASSRTRINHFCRERDGALPVVDPESPSQAEVDSGNDHMAAGDAAGQETPEISLNTSSDNGPAGGEAVTAPVVPMPEPSDTGDEQPVAGDSEHGREPPPGGPEQSPPAEEPLFSVSFPVIEPLKEQESGNLPMQAADKAGAETDASQDIPEAETPSEVPEPGTGTVTRTGEPEHLFEPFGNDAERSLQSRPEHGPAGGDGSPAVVVPVHVTGKESVSPAMPGSGTDTPRMRSLAATSRIERAEKRDSKETPGRDQAGKKGIFARIVSAISSLFRGS